PAYVSLYNAVVRTLGDEGFALFSAPLRPGMFEFLCRTTAGSTTLARRRRALPGARAARPRDHGVARTRRRAARDRRTAPPRSPGARCAPRLRVRMAAAPAARPRLLARRALHRPALGALPVPASAARLRLRARLHRAFRLRRRDAPRDVRRGAPRSSRRARGLRCRCLPRRRAGTDLDPVSQGPRDGAARARAARARPRGGILARRGGAGAARFAAHPAPAPRRGRLGLARDSRGAAARAGARAAREDASAHFRHRLRARLLGAVRLLPCVPFVDRGIAQRLPQTRASSPVDRPRPLRHPKASRESPLPCSKRSSSQTAARSPAA